MEPDYDDPDTFPSPVQEAYSLSEAAVMLDQARANKGSLATALEHNMELWVAIRMLISREDNAIPPETSENLKRLSQFIAETTMLQGVEITSETLDTLININLQISEGLLEGGQQKIDKSGRSRMRGEGNRDCQFVPFGVYGQEVKPTGVRCHLDTEPALRGILSDSQRQFNVGGVRTHTKGVLQ